MTWAELAEDADLEKRDGPMGGEVKNCVGKSRDGGRDGVGGIARGG